MKGEIVWVASTNNIVFTFLAWSLFLLLKKVLPPQISSRSCVLNLVYCHGKDDIFLLCIIHTNINNVILQVTSVNDLCLGFKSKR